MKTSRNASQCSSEEEGGSLVEKRKKALYIFLYPPVPLSEHFEQPT